MRDAPETIAAKRKLLEPAEKHRRKIENDRRIRADSRASAAREMILHPGDIVGNVDVVYHASCGESVQPWEIRAAIRREMGAADPDAWYESGGRVEPDFAEIEATIDRDFGERAFLWALINQRQERIYLRIWREKERARFRG